MPKERILICATSADRLGQDGVPTGVWMEELTAPYYVFQGAGYEVAVASVKGGKVPVDEKSLTEEWAGEATKRFRQDGAAQAAFDKSVAAEGVTIEDYVALYVPGGHGIVADGDSPQLTALIEKFYEQGRVVGAVCHGPAALLPAHKMALNLEGRVPLVQGEEVAGFTDTEEAAIAPPRDMPWSLEGQLRAKGAHYRRGDDWASFVVTSGRLVTGQNPQSSQAVGEAMVKAIQGNALFEGDQPVAG